MDHLIKRLRLRYAGACALCGITLPKDGWALSDRETKTVRCITCPEATPDAEIDTGVAGGSARGEFQRRKEAREERVKSRAGTFLGGLILALTDEPKSTRAWERGAVGEEKLAKTLQGVEGLITLHDR